MSKSKLSPLTPETGLPSAQIILDIPDSTKSLKAKAIITNDTIDCPICYNDYSPDSMQSLLPCKHSFCKTCIKNYFESRMKSFQVLNIPCPYAGCKEVFSTKIIEKGLDEKQYKAFNELVLKKVANRDFTQRFCPKPGCSKVFSPKQNEAFTLCSCGTKICNSCHNFSHEGKTCLEAIDQEFELYSKENDVKFCVMCKTVTKREEGCLHITCPVCDYEWCWNCGREYKRRHVCPGYWSPAAPTSFKTKFLSMDSFKEAWMNGSALKRLLLTLFLIVAVPFMLIGFMLFWPLIMSIENGTELTIKKPFKLFCQVLTSLFFGIASLPITLFYVLCMIFFIVVILLPLFLIYALVQIIRREPITYQTPAKNNQKRWQTGDSKNFEFRASGLPLGMPVVEINTQEQNQVAQKAGKSEIESDGSISEGVEIQIKDNVKVEKSESFSSSSSSYEESEKKEEEISFKNEEIKV